MKNLEINEMENFIAGSAETRECMLRGAGTGLALILGFWAAALVLVSTSSKCFEI